MAYTPTDVHASVLDLDVHLLDVGYVLAHDKLHQDRMNFGLTLGSQVSLRVSLGLD